MTKEFEYEIRELGRILVIEYTPHFTKDVDYRGISYDYDGFDIERAGLTDSDGGETEVDPSRLESMLGSNEHTRLCLAIKRDAIEALRDGYGRD